MDDFRQNFMHGFHGNRASDFYIKYNARGAKLYYSRITNKQVAKGDIPPKLINLITEQEAGLDVANLTNLKKGYEMEIARLQAKIAEIDAKLASASSASSSAASPTAATEKFDEETLRQYLKQKETQDRLDEQRRAEYVQEKKRQWQEFMGRYGSRSSHYSSSTPSASPATANREILKELKITTKKEWKTWLLANHPDKCENPNLDLVQKVIAAGRVKGW